MVLISMKKQKKSGHYIELDPAMSMEEAKEYANKMDVLYTDTWVDMEFFNNPAYQKAEGRNPLQR